MFYAYRCRFCGDVYMGDKAPSHCPYCGAHAAYLVPIEAWTAPGPQDLSAQSRSNLEEALKLEVDNTAYYGAAAAKVQDAAWQGIFKYLARIEGEHAGTIRKALALNVNPSPPKIEAAADLKAAVSEVQRREAKAGQFYQQALAEAKEARVKEIFACLIEIEADHLQLAGETLAKL